MILVILGAQNSPPKTPFSLLFSWNVRKDPNAKPSYFIQFTMNSPAVSTKTILEKQMKNKENTDAPTSHWKSPKLQNLCICNVFTSQKSSLDASLGPSQVGPRGPKTNPGSSQEPSELSEGPLGPPGRPGSHETQGQLIKSKGNKITRIKTEMKIKWHERKLSKTSSCTPASVISMDVRPKRRSQRMD